jgi:hypothetical protein
LPPSEKRFSEPTIRSCRLPQLVADLRWTIAGVHLVLAPCPHREFHPGETASPGPAEAKFLNRDTRVRPKSSIFTGVASDCLNV